MDGPEPPPEGGSIQMDDLLPHWFMVTIVTIMCVVGLADVVMMFWFMVSIP
jgi:hypothetical protein